MAVADLTIQGEPATKQRPRVVRRGVRTRAYTPQATRDAEDVIRWELLAAGVTPNENDDLLVRLAFFCTTRQRKDIDNMVKVVLDACNGHAWKDDMQVVRLEIDLERGVGKADARTELYVEIVSARSWTCDQCGKTMPGTPRADQKFCSKTCYDTAQRTGHWRMCNGCGEPVYKQRDRAASSRSVYCSAECRARCKGLCRECKAPLAERQKSFCSDACRTVWWARRPVTGRHKNGVCRDCGKATYDQTAKRCRACHLTQLRTRGRAMFGDPLPEGFAVPAGN